MIGFQEIIIIVIIAAIILGPGLFVKLGKRGKQTADSLKKGIESGAKAAGADIDLSNTSKDDVLKGIGKLQDRVDEMLNDVSSSASEDAPAAEAAAESTPAAEGAAAGAAEDAVESADC